jgi:glutamyl-Q tRNA(Asp) synthetase
MLKYSQSCFGVMKGFFISMSAEPVVGRFAPSPTGPLHFGSLVAAVGSYCLARRKGGLWLLRMEDLDPPRVVAGSADEILFALESLGLHWDGEIVWQSQRSEAYLEAVELLRNKGLVFDCACTRKEIILSAPHPGEDGPIYPGTCRAGLPAGRKPRALRIEVSQEQVHFCDGVFGPVQQVLADAVGDFVLRRADGLFAYQLAVVVDDADAGINQVVRGADLLSSTPRQIFLNACLGHPVPEYIHLPMVLGRNGKKISKRHGSVGLAYESGASKLITQSLILLGQTVPGELQGAPPVELLCWAVQNFEPRSIPAVSEGVGVDEELL